MTASTRSPLADRMAWLGLFLGPMVALAVHFLLARSDLDPAARSTALVAALMAVWWLTEAIPLPVTAVLPLLLFPMLGVMPIEAAAAPYADKIVFLFMGGFLLSLAMEKWSLHRRIAYTALAVCGGGPRPLIGGILLTTSLISAWVSNTATAVLMLPIALGVAALIRARRNDDEDSGRFASAAVLAVAYGASIGGVCTLIGTPPNAIFAAVAKSAVDREVSFAQWMRIGVPMAAIFLPIAWAWIVYFAFPLRFRLTSDDVRDITTERRALGPMSRPEWAVFLVFMAAALCWILRSRVVAWTGFRFFSDEWIALLAAGSLFVIPTDIRKREFVMDWKTAERLPWSVLILFGGGLSLSEGIRASHLDVAIGNSLGALEGMHPLPLIFCVATAMVFLSELASNTAMATTLLPVLAAAAKGLGVDPFVLMVPGTLACSLAFMMPAGTPPNALAYATGAVSLPRMIRTGLALNIASCLCVSLYCYALYGGR